MEFVKSYGGREKYFKRTSVKDCVIRAICNATKKDYMEVYLEIKSIQKEYYRNQEIYKGKKTSPRNGVPNDVTKEYMEKVLKWKWHPLKNKDLTTHNWGKYTYIVSMNHHLTCIKNHKLYDSWDCQKKRDQRIIGYWSWN